MMEYLQQNMSTFSDNVIAITPLYNPYNASVSTINNMVWPEGINYSPHNTPSLNTTSMMVIRQQMDESNLELVSIHTQQMGTIFNPWIANTNQTYEVLANQMGCIAAFFGTPPVCTSPNFSINIEC